MLSYLPLNGLPEEIFKQNRISLILIFYTIDWLQNSNWQMDHSLLEEVTEDFNTLLRIFKQISMLSFMHDK